MLNWSPSQISDFVVQAFPEINKEQQLLSLCLYRSLALGKSVAVEQLQKKTGLTAEFISQSLQSWSGVFFDDNKYVTGFWGLTTRETSHRLNVNGQTSYTWCAWDSLFIPALLSETVQVSSLCPVTKRKIELEISPDQVKVIGDKTLYVSFLVLDEAEMKEDIIAKFCHFVYFFDSKSVAEQWLSEHHGTFLLSLDDAFSIGKNFNAARYNLTLK